jgi:hypothetical protein
MPSRYPQVTLDRDHARPRHQPAPSNAEIEARLIALVGPATQAVGDAARALGVRQRVLTLPLMVAAVLTLIWRQLPSVAELGRVLAREDLLGQARRTVSQQALSLRLRCLPATLFAQVFAELLPVLQARAAGRSRPVPAVLTRAQQHYAHIWAVDGTTLEAVFHKVGLRRPDTGTTQAGGKGLAVLDVATRLPVAVWLDADAQANDLRFADQVQAQLTAPTLLLADAQFTHYPFWDALTDAGHALICRAKENLAIQAVERVLVATPRVRDRIIRIGSPGHPCAHPVRLIEVSQNGRRWHRLICTEVDPAVLGTADVVDLYAQRWRIEDAFLVTKRLLGLSYLWSGAFNAIALQVWATWLFYAVLVDLTDAVAEALQRPLGDLSLEMVYRGLYHYTVAAARGEAAEPIAYLAAQDDLGIVKRRRPSRERQRAARDSWRSELNL